MHLTRKQQAQQAVTAHSSRACNRQQPCILRARGSKQGAANSPCKHRAEFMGAVRTQGQQQASIWRVLHLQHSRLVQAQLLPDPRDFRDLHC